MKISAVALGILLVTALGGCGSQRELAHATKPAAAAVEDTAETIALTGTTPNVVCKYEARTGSHLKRRVCFTKTEIRRMSAEAQEWLRSGGARGGVTHVSR